MRILIHALAALENGGSDRHLRGMVSALGDYPETEYLIYVNPTFHLTNLPANVDVRAVSVKNFWQRLWWDQVVLSKIIRKERIDIIWATLYFGPLWPPVPQIMFQRYAMYYCDHYLDNLNLKMSLITSLRRLLLYFIMRSSFSIVSPSIAMRDMIRSKHPDVAIRKFEVIPHAIFEEDFKKISDTGTKVSAPVGSNNLKLLYVGHLMPFKGLFTLLDSLAQVVKRTTRHVKLSLTIAREDWPKGFDRFTDMVAKLGIEQYVQILGKVPGSQISSLYENSDILVYPSLCESFGFPLIEAMSRGIAIVAADTAINRELAGDAAIYYPGADIEKTVATLLKVIDDAVFRKTLGKIGQVRFENNHLEWNEYVGRCIKLSNKAVA